MGLFSNNYDNAGSGVAKSETRKKGAALFFDLLGRKFWSLMWLNLLYILFFIPLFLIFGAISLINNDYALLAVVGLLLLTFAVTIGPATAGMMKVQRLFFIEKHSFITRDFFNGFKENFKPAAVIGFIDCVLIASAYASLSVYPVLAVNYTRLFYIPMVITFSVFLIVFIMNFYIFLMLTATDLSLKDLFKNSFTLAIAAPKPNLLTVAAYVLCALLMGFLMYNVFSVFTLLLPVFPAAFLAFVTCFNCYPVIQKYVIDPFYTAQGKVNPEYLTGAEDIDEETIFEDMGGKEAPVENRKKTKAKVIK